MLPIELLEKELDELNRAFKKSGEMYMKNLIDGQTHRKHIANLTPKIKAYNNAISILKTYE